MKATPPKWPIKFFRWYCRKDFADDIEGDLVEHFYHRKKKNKPAKLLLILDVFRLFRPGIVSLPISIPNKNTISMFRHFLTISLRKIWKEKTLTFINIFGLIVGITSVFLLSKYIGFHQTRDNFQENKDQIFAIHQTLNSNEVSDKHNKSTFNGVAPILKEKFAEVKGMSRYITTAEALFLTKSTDGTIQKYNENRIVEVDQDFLQMITLDFIGGDPSTALLEPNTMVVSSSFAKKYFGDVNPIGKIITSKKRWGSKADWRITGVFKDYPKRSIFRFDALQSLTNKEFEVSSQDWNYPFFKSYLFIDNKVDLKELEVKMSSAINSFEGMQNEGKTVELSLVSFEDLVQLSEWQIGLIIIGIILMLMTWMNYSNLSISQSMKRNLELGIRKVMGSNNGHFINQFLSEAFVLYCIAFFGSYLLIVFLYPILYNITDGELLPLLYFDSSILIWPLVFLFVGSLVSSIIPPVGLSGLSISGLMKGKVHNKLNISSFRNVLVTVQLVFSVVMLIGVFIISDQMQFIKNKDLGFDSNNILILKAPKDGWDGKHRRLANLKQELRSKAIINHVSSSSTVPLWWPGAPTDYKLTENSKNIRLKGVGVDEYYFKCYGIEVLAGEEFYRDDSGRAQKSAIINQSAVKELGFSEPSAALNQNVIDQKTGKSYRIIGVCKDYHHESLRKEIIPQIFYHNPFIGNITIQFGSKELQSYGDLSAIITEAESVWNNVYPEQAFDFYFMDQRLQELYRNENLFESIFYAVALICIIINFLGIFGLSVFIALSKRKEIGVRKTLGAEKRQIILLFTDQFTRKVMIAIIAGIPIAYYLINFWLVNFKYQTSIEWWHFILPSLVLILVVQLSVTFESLKMAKVNPIDILHEE